MPKLRHLSHTKPLRTLPETQNPQLQMPKMPNKHTKPRIRRAIKKDGDLLGCLTRLYILIKRHVEEIAIEYPNDYAKRKKKKRSTFFKRLLESYPAS